MSTDTGADERPVLRVIHGDASPEEIAVLLALAASRGGDPADPVQPPRRGRWNDPARQHRGPLLPGPGGWRAARW